MSDERLPRIAFIGFGEAAEAFAKGWGRDLSAGLHAYDEKCDDAQARALPAGRAEATGVTLAADRAGALRDAGAVFCLVTADRAVLAAEQAAPHLAPGRSGWTATVARPAQSAAPPASSRRPAGAMSMSRSWRRSIPGCTARRC